uniref:Uncharacterized protein n=1 Tax=Anguilla anguilla TaxID=7936 RepID=A0A0E9W8E8_ANGAN
MQVSGQTVPAQGSFSTNKLPASGLNQSYLFTVHLYVKPMFKNKIKIIK